MRSSCVGDNFIVILNFIRVANGTCNSVLSVAFADEQEVVRGFQPKD